VKEADRYLTFLWLETTAVCLHQAARLARFPVALTCDLSRDAIPDEALAAFGGIAEGKALQDNAASLFEFPLHFPEPVLVQ
jgi:hypothetical protein